MSQEPSIHQAAHAQLREARSHTARGAVAAAKQAYENIATNAAYLPHLRAEARELREELTRLENGLPPRNVAATHTHVPHITTFAAEVWVAPHGDNAARGTEEQPVASLAKARDVVRTLRAKGLTGAVAVRVKSGAYRLRESFALTAEDSGTQDSPVVYRAESNGTAVFRGGIGVDGFTNVTAPDVRSRLPRQSRDRVVQCDLKKLGITDYGTLRTRGRACGITHESTRTQSEL